MKEEKTKNRIGITGVCTAILLALKLGGVIDCSWLIVFTPVLFGVGINVLIVLGFYIEYRWYLWQLGRTK